MSQSLQSLTLTCVLGGETFSSALFTSNGDLFQRYNDQKVVPDYTVAANQPVLNYTLASNKSQGELIPDSIDIYYDGKKVVFSKSGSDVVSDDNMFRKSGGGTQPFKIRVLQNFCSAQPTSVSQPGHTIKVVGKIGAASYPAIIAVDIQPLNDEGEELHIVAGTLAANAKPFTIEKSAKPSIPSCELVAKIYKGGEELSDLTGYAFRWERQVPASVDPSGWQRITSGTGADDFKISGTGGNTLTVPDKQVESFAVFRVKTTAKNGGEELVDSQQVMDLGDTYYVALDVKDGDGNPADPAFPVDSTDTDKRVITASLLARNGTTPPAAKFTWQLMRPDGTLTNSGTGTDANGVASATEVTPTIKIPKKHLTENGVDNLVVTSIAEFD